MNAWRKSAYEGRSAHAARIFGCSSFWKPRLPCWPEVSEAWHSGTWWLNLEPAECTWTESILGWPPYWASSRQQWSGCSREFCRPCVLHGYIRLKPFDENAARPADLHTRVVRPPDEGYACDVECGSRSGGRGRDRSDRPGSQR